MKKILSLISFIFIFAGCEQSDKNYDAPRKGEDIISPFYTITINDCEYIRSFRALAHKGNCKYCARRDSIKWEQRKQELIEIIKSTE